jgi:hypothetical protein
LIYQRTWLNFIKPFLLVPENSDFHFSPVSELAPAHTSEACDLIFVPGWQGIGASLHSLCLYTFEPGKDGLSQAPVSATFCTKSRVFCFPAKN